MGLLTPCEVKKDPAAAQAKVSKYKANFRRRLVANGRRGNAGFLEQSILVFIDEIKTKQQDVTDAEKTVSALGPVLHGGAEKNASLPAKPWQGTKSKLHELQRSRARKRCYTGSSEEQ